MHNYRVEYWFLSFYKGQDMGYDYDIVDVEAEDEATALKIAEIKAPRGAKKFKIVE